MRYRVMEYLDSTRACPIGYAFLGEQDYATWQRGGNNMTVRGYVVVGGMEECAEWGCLASVGIGQGLVSG